MGNCDDNKFCLSTFVDLCVLIGQACGQWKLENFWDIVLNQRRLLNAIAPLIDDLADAAPCCRIYFDTDACAFTTTAGATTIPAGVHAFGGRVVFDGQHHCAKVSADCGQRLDGDFNPVDCGGAWIVVGESDCGALLLPLPPTPQRSAFLTGSASASLGLSETYTGVTVVSNDGFDIDAATGEVCFDCDCVIWVSHNALVADGSGTIRLDVFSNGTLVDGTHNYSPTVNSFGVEANRPVAVAAGDCLTFGIRYDGAGGSGGPILNVLGFEIYIEERC